MSEIRILKDQSSERKCTGGRVQGSSGEIGVRFVNLTSNEP